MAKRRNNRKRPGRKRDQDLKREPSGRPQHNHAHHREDMRSVVVKQRMQHHGATKEQARKADCGSVVGRSIISGLITQQEAIALQHYQYDRVAICRVMGVPVEPLRAINIDPDASLSGSSRPDVVPKKAHEIRLSWSKVLSCLFKAGIESGYGPKVSQTVAEATMREIEPKPEVLRIGAIALREHYGLPDDRRTPRKAEAVKLVENQ